jgi:Predicted membrane protein
MNRNEFLTILERSLVNMSPSDREDILYDYKEHFNAGLTEGKTEEEISKALGDPKTIAKQYKVDYIVKKADENRNAGNILRALFAALSLGFFNLIFILPVFAALIGILFGFYGTAIGVTFSGIGIFLMTILHQIYPNSIDMINLNPGVLIFGSVGLISMGLLISVADIYITKFFYHITIKYIKANAKIISR